MLGVIFGGIGAIIIPIILMGIGGFLIVGKKNNKGWILLIIGAIIFIFSLLIIDSMKYL
jgi:hypothetical protein